MLHVLLLTGFLSLRRSKFLETTELLFHSSFQHMGLQGTYHPHEGHIPEIRV